MNALQPHFTISEEDKLYLSGEVFSNQKKFFFTKKSFIPERNDLLMSLMSNKKVLHFGCCDHEGLIESKFKTGSHLQVNISKVAESCVGIDIDKKALNRMKKLGITNCYYYDLFETNNNDLENQVYDYVLLGELLEHITNPVMFLSLISQKFKNAKKIVITVPNAFNSKNINNIKRGIEEINTDHKYWFTPYTISKVITEAGFNMNCLYFVDRSRISTCEKVIKWYYLIQRKNPFTSKKWHIDKANGIVAIASF